MGFSQEKGVDGVGGGGGVYETTVSDHNERGNQQ